MSNRRDFLKTSVVAAAAAAAGVQPAAARYRVAPSTLPPPTQGRGGSSFPNVIVASHTGKKYRFYQDLVFDRVVGINFFTLRGHTHFPATTHLRRVAEVLGERLGRNVFLYSITTDPEHDTVERLRDFAREHDLPPGWLLLRVDVATDAAAVSERLYKHGMHGGGHPVRMVHYGHGRLNVWGAFGVDAEPSLCAERFSWLQVSSEPVSREKPRRAGPRRLEGDYLSSNRES